MAHKLLAVDLFSGAGGTGLGFSRAGFEIVGALELNPYAAATYERNLGVRVTQADIRSLSPFTFRNKLSLDRGQLDVLIGCPPCQGFTRLRNSLGQGDSRNELVFRYLEYVEEFQPRFTVFENVPGLIKTKHGRDYFNRLTEGLYSLGYRFEPCIVDAADYGVPQHRKRVIVVARYKADPPPIPEPTHRKTHKTVRDAIGNGNYPALEYGENGEEGGRFPNHIAPLTSEKVLSFIRMVPKDGGSRTDVPRQYWLPCHLSHDGHKDVYGRLAWDRPSGTITGGCTNPSKGRFVHPEQDRAITPREAAKLQGFPDNFVFWGRNVPLQIGNAVPPPLAEAIAISIMDMLAGG